MRQKGKPRVITQWLELREIRVRVQRAGHCPQELRLCTSLADPKRAPAQELIDLYARRWEHELYYRELKQQERSAPEPHAGNGRAGNRGGGAGQRAAGERAGAGGGWRSACPAGEFHQDAGADAALVADAGAGRGLVERAVEAPTDRTLPGTGRWLCDAAAEPAQELSAGGAPAGERLAAAARKPIVGRPRAFQSSLTMNSRKALGQGQSIF